MTDSLYKGTGGHNYIQDEDMETSFIKQQQEEAFRQFYFMTECKACPPYEFIDDMTAQIIKNTCELIRSQIKHSPQIEIDIEQVKNARAIEIKYIEDIINNITNV